MGNRPGADQLLGAMDEVESQFGEGNEWLREDALLSVRLDAILNIAKTEVLNDGLAGLASSTPWMRWAGRPQSIFVLAGGTEAADHLHELIPLDDVQQCDRCLMARRRLQLALYTVVVLPTAPGMVAFVLCHDCQVALDGDFDRLTFDVPAGWPRYAPFG